MNAVFVGGGSFRTLPIVRAAMSGDNAFQGGGIWLVDFNLERAETVGRLIMKTPEYAKSNCEIKWTKNLDEALPGADLVSVSFPVGSAKMCMLSQQASQKYGFHGSDQLSLSGAFRSLTGGVIILDIAKRMEKLCPRAWLVDHANPVAVYSGLVNNHTKIKSLGLCGSCYHPYWDLAKLLLDQEYSNDFNIASAGVNHMTFVIRGDYKGRDILKMLDEKYGNNPWKPKLAGVPPAFRKTLLFSYQLSRQMRNRFGIIPCSNEFDGLCQLFPDEFPASWHLYKPETAAELRANEKKGRENREKLDIEFRAHLDRKLDAAFWARSCHENPHFAISILDPTAVVMKALGTGKPQKLGASFPNRGAIKGIKDRTIVEYSFTFDKNGVHPDPDLEVPDCFHGLISSLASHQTLLGDAIATRDPKLFSDALYAYPHHQSTKNATALWKELLKVHAAEIPAEFQKAKDYFK